MKTSEFIRKVKELNYMVVDSVEHIRVYFNSLLVAEVHKNEVKSLSTVWNKYVSDLLFDILVEYARTPIEERKEPKKYYLYNPVRNKYFNYDIENKIYFWLSPTETHEVQTKFTEEEIKNHKFIDIMELLEKEEVREC